MSGALEPTLADKELLMLSLAKEIAQDIFPIETILKAHQTDQTTFETIMKLPRFQMLLDDAIRAWTAAQNTAERIKLKSLTSIEASLPELHARLHDVKEGLNHKVELLKAMTRLAGLGESTGRVEAGERISISINMGADKELKIAAALPTRVIEGELTA